MIARLRALMSTNKGRAIVAVAIGLAIALVLVVRSRLGGGSAAPAPSGPMPNAPGVVGDVPTGYASDMAAAGIPAGGFDFAPNLAAVESEFDFALESVSDRMAKSAAAMQDAIDRQREATQAEIERLQALAIAPVANVQTTGAGGGSTGPTTTTNQTATTGLPRWTPPAGIKIGAPTDIAGATFAGRVRLSNGQYAPIIKYRSTGTSQIHPEWQRWMAANKVTRA